MVLFGRKIKRKAENENLDGVITVVISLRPKFISRAKETANELVEDYNISEYEKIVSYDVGSMYIYCDINLESLKQIYEAGTNEGENRIEEVFIPS